MTPATNPPDHAADRPAADRPAAPSRPVPAAESGSRQAASTGSRQSAAGAAAVPLAALLALAMTVLAACGLSRPYPSVRSFTLAPASPAEAAAEAPSDAAAPPRATAARAAGRRMPVVLVSVAGAAAACETRKMVYRIGPDELAEDFYNEFAGIPARMIADSVAARLEASGRWRAERSPGLESPDRLLEIFVGAFHGDLTANPQAAVLEVRFTLSDARRRRVLLSRTYSSVQPLGDGQDRPAALAAGLGRAFGDVLRRLEADLEAAADGQR